MQHITRFAGTISQVLIRYKNELLWILAGIALIVPLGYAARLRVDAIADARQGVVLAADGVVTVGRVPLLAEVPGVVRQVPVKGARVTQGQQLVRLDDPDLEAAVVSARLQLEAARTNLTQAGVAAGADQTGDPNSALQLATLALEAVEKATDTLRSGISAATRPQQTAPAAGNQDRKVTQAQAGPPQSPHHGASAPVLPMGGHGQKPSTPVPAQAKEDNCELHQQVSEVTKLFETVTVSAGASGQPAATASGSTLMEQLVAQVEAARLNVKEALAASSVAAPVSTAGGAEAHEKVQQAQTQLALAERKLQKTSVVAPVTGTVLEVSASSGTPVNAGQTLVILSDDASTYVGVPVTVKAAELVKPGQKAVVTIGAQTLNGKVATVEFDPDGQQAMIKVTMERLELRFADGTAARVKIMADIPQM